MTTPPVSGYTVWLDATAITGVSDGTALTTWNDLSGNGNNFTTASAPTYYNTTPTGLLNGLPSVSFTPTTYMITHFTTPAVYTWYVTAQLNAGLPHSYYMLLQAWGSLGINIYDQTNITSDGTTFLTDGTRDTSPHTYTGVFNGTSSMVRGTTQVTGNSGPGRTYSQIILGNDASAADGWNGLIGEVVMYPFAVTAAQDALILNYLNAKWVPPVAPLVVGPLTHAATKTNVLGGGVLTLIAVTVN